MEKGLKNTPKCRFPPNLVGAASTSGSMDSDLMLDYIDRVLVPSLRGRRTLLLLDKYKAHSTEVVLRRLTENNITPMFIPGKISASLSSLSEICDFFTYWNLRWICFMFATT